MKLLESASDYHITMSQYHDDGGRHRPSYCNNVNVVEQTLTLHFEKNMVRFGNSIYEYLMDLILFVTTTFFDICDVVVCEWSLYLKMYVSRFPCISFVIIS